MLKITVQVDGMMCGMCETICDLWMLHGRLYCIMDGGITHYELPWIITRLIAVRDFTMVMLGTGYPIYEKALSGYSV